MGRDRRPARPPRSALSRRFDLRGEANRFAGELSDLLNNTVTDGIRIRAVTDRAGQRASIGYELPPRDLVNFKMIPLARQRDKPNLYLGMLFRMAPDDASRYPMIRSSVIFLSLDNEPDGRTVLHYDYERDKADDYPEAHLQVCATSPEWEEIAGRRPLEKLHLPVRGRRFRPTIEDLIKFLIVEKLVKARDGWQEPIERGREGFELRQLRAAVRRNPEAALSVLRQEGHIR